MLHQKHNFLSLLTISELGAFLKVVNDSLLVRRHADLFNWLHEEVQLFVPHDILIAAWGDFSLGLVHLDIVSYLPGARTTEVDKQEIMPFAINMYGMWLGSGRESCSLNLQDGGEDFRMLTSSTEFGKSVKMMRTAIVQGIKDERGRQDCLYIALHSSRNVELRAVRAMEYLLPNLDAALRRVEHLPDQYLSNGAWHGEPLADGSAIATDLAEEVVEHDLTLREQEIMHWVSLGKTNSEIGCILNISAFTVKNHLQRIFRKLDVLNRAQAVSLFKRRGVAIDG